MGENTLLMPEQGWAVYRCAQNTGIYFHNDINFSYTAIPVNGTKCLECVLQYPEVFQWGPISLWHHKTTGDVKRSDVDQTIIYYKCCGTQVAAGGGKNLPFSSAP